MHVKPCWGAYLELSLRESTQFLNPGELSELRVYRLLCMGLLSGVRMTLNRTLNGAGAHGSSVDRIHGSSLKTYRVVQDTICLLRTGL